MWKFRQEAAHSCERVNECVGEGVRKGEAMLEREWASSCACSEVRELSDSVETGSVS